jgi:hypothetical protein
MEEFVFNNNTGIHISHELLLLIAKKLDIKQEAIDKAIDKGKKDQEGEVVDQQP